MIHLRTTWGTAFLLAASGLAAAQGTDLAELLHAGARNNPDLLVHRAEGEGIAGDSLSATTSPNPVLGLEAGYNVNDPSRPMASLRLSQEYRPGIRDRKSRAARASLDANLQSQKALGAETELEIRSAFFRWQILARKKALQVQAEKRWEALARIATAKVKEGRLSQVDEAQARLNLAKARERESGIQGEMETELRRLAFLTGFGKAPDSLAAYPIEPVPPLIPLDTLTRWALAENAGLKTLSLEIAARRREAELEAALRNPGFTLSVGYDRETDGNDVVGGGVELPLPFTDRNRAGQARSRAALRAAEARKAAEAARVASTVAALHARLARLEERHLAFRNEVLPLSAKQLELSEKGFVQGLLGIFDLSRVQEEALDRESDALDILDEYYAQWNRLGMAVGGKTW
jgi:cobalt-zinc-cadmium efflux system outer membrane protein